MRDLYTQGLLDNGCELEPNEPGGVFFFGWYMGVNTCYGEPWEAWEMCPSPHLEKPVGSEVGGQDPHVHG